MTDMFLIGASATKAYRAALGAVAENISNANTANYSRRTVNLRESAASGGASVLSLPTANFGGVEVGGVNRANDRYLDQAMRLSGNLLGSADARLLWIGDMETALNDSGLGIGQRLTDFFSAVQRLAANPGDTTLRNGMLSNLEAVAHAFNQTAASLQQVTSGIADVAGNDISALNQAINDLANVNEGLRRALPGTTAHVQLLDSRDAALQEISRHLDVSISFGEKGVASVDYRGAVVVESTVPTQFALIRNSDGTLALSHEGSAVPNPGGGRLEGLVRSAALAVERMQAVDDLAAQLAGDINDWHAAGRTNADLPGAPLLSITGSAASLSFTGLGTNDIAAATPGGASNGNLINIASIRNAGSVEQGWTQLVSTHGNLMAATKAEQASAANRDHQARLMRENISGVDLDQEAADLLRYQQAYQAAARIIQVAREINQSILNL